MYTCLFVAVFLCCTSTGRVGLCFFVVLCPGTPEGSTGSDSGFKASQKTGQRLKVWEKPGIEPEAPGLQDIGLSPTPRRLICIHGIAARALFSLWLPPFSIRVARFSL